MGDVSVTVTSSPLELLAVHSPPVEPSTKQVPVPSAFSELNVVSGGRSNIQVEGAIDHTIAAMDEGPENEKSPKAPADCQVITVSEQ